jgi:hypothetical protein
MSEFSFYQNDAAMLYELLLRTAYHCGRGDDPFGLANTDMYSVDEKDNIEVSAFVGIWTALYLIKSQINSSKDLEYISQIRRNFERNPTGTYFKSIVPELSKLLEQSQISEFPHVDSIPYNKY